MKTKRNIFYIYGLVDIIIHLCLATASITSSSEKEKRQNTKEQKVEMTVCAPESSVGLELRVPCNYISKQANKTAVVRNDIGICKEYLMLLRSYPQYTHSMETVCLTADAEPVLKG